MFAKLKKKIQEETHNVVIGNEEKKHPRPSMSGTSSAVSSPGTAASSPTAAVSSSGTAMSSPRSSTSSRGTPSPQPAASSPGPGLASPVNKDFQGVVPVHSLSDTSSRSYHRADSESSALDTDSKDKEEILAMLIKRTDQVKRLESKISDLAAMVKEKNRQVEKLELSLEGLHNASQQPLNGSERNKLTKTPSADQVNTDYDVSKITDQMRASNNHADRRESELMSLQKQIDVLTDRCRDLEERNQFLEKNIENERSAKEEALSKCAKLEKELEELQEFQQVYETLKMQLESLRADSELEKKKLQTEIEAKNQQCSNLQDKIIMLEKRLKDSNLTEDDQIQAIEKQRETLELQLSEVQEQLAQLKLVSGHKVAALEQKVQHLNSKVAEQVRELSISQRNLQDARNVSEREVESWKNKLQMALLEVMEKSKQLETQKQNHESEIARRQKNASLLEDELREQINQLQSQLETVDKSRQREKQAFQDKIAKLENKQEEWLEQEIDRERQVTQLEDELRKLKGEVLEKDNEIMSLRRQMEQKREELALAEKKRVEDQESTKEHLKNADKYQSSVITLENELHTCTQEKDSLLLRNAQLSQEFESYKRRMMSELKDLQQDVGEKDEVIKQLEQCSTDLHQQINMLQEKITELEQRQEEVVGVAQCEEVNELKRQLLESENQLADKNKTIKMLQQRLNELKKTLQRELKVQSLPNDETSGRLTPSSSTKDLNQSASAMTNNVTNNHKHEDSVPASIPVTAQRRLDCPPSHQSKRSNLSHRHHCLPAYSSVPQDVLASQHTQNSSLRGHYCDPKDFSYDINFEYLKHVVLKFLLSREHEAVHLIKALSMLLHFTPDEQRLIKDTLDWKMSWFGTRPQLGRGQLAKVIPSSY